jgi:alpha-N-acetylglucosaminidase
MSDTKGEAADLVGRILGAAAQRVSVEIAPSTGSDTVEIEASGGEVRLVGSSGIAVAVGLRHYLEQSCGVQVTWLDEPIPVPDAFPSLSRTRPAARFPIRYHLNYVTFAYSTLFWQWDRWEREIDRMAMHGINAPLALTGHEAVWRAVLLGEGMSDDEVAAYLGGAPYLPFLWMGCLTGWDRPLPEGWIDARERLGRRILDRERALGMRPVLPGFAGHVPTALADGAAELQWEGFRSWQLPADHPTYPRIAERLRAEQRTRFGGDHLYATDPFIEMVPASGDPGYLADIARRVVDGVTIDDPDAVWVFQAWPFYYQSSFWTQERVRAFLDAIPPDRVLILDLWAEHLPLWQHTDGFRGRPWAWSVVHNFGERPGLFGDVRALVDRFSDAIDGSAASMLSGIGLAMEGLGTNPVIYDLTSDLAWFTPPGDVRQWMVDWASRRYGTDDVRIRDAWRILADTVYGPGRDLLPPSPIVMRPGRDDEATQGWGPDGALPDLVEAYRLLVDAADVVDHRDPYLRDLVDIGQQVLVIIAGKHRRAVTAAAHAGDLAGATAAGAALLDVLDDLDNLLATREEHLLGRWLTEARSWGETAAERIHLERSARLLITVWGHPDTNLYDYSGRHWAGLISSFYRPRFEVWLDWITTGDADNGSDVDLDRRLSSFEQMWIRSEIVHTNAPIGDSLAMARQLDQRLRSSA